MSVESLAIALNHSRATGSARLILIGIANHDGDGGAWPSQSTLAKYAGGISRSRVKAATDRLIELGEIVVERNAGGTVATREWERPHLYRFVLTCPATCDRSTQHRDRTRHYIEFEPASVTIPGGGTEIPHPVSPEYPDQVSDTPQEPSFNPSTKTSRGNHLPRTCAKGHDLLPEGGYCVMGCNVRRHLEAVPS